MRTLIGADDAELFRKRLVLDKHYLDMAEYMLEDTLFNLMEEGTYEEFDLAQIPRTYIRKEFLEDSPQKTSSS